MGDKEDYLMCYRKFFESFAETVNPEDQLPVHVAGYTITEAELPGEVLLWTSQYLIEKQCPAALMTPLSRIILDEVRTASKKQPSDWGFKAEDSVYIALRLMQAVTARVNAVCLRYLDNAKLDTLPPPPAPPYRELLTTSACKKNSRRAMEDRHVEIGNLDALFGIESTEPTAFYAVYDGHAGSAAAVYCAAHLHQYLAESAHYRGDLRRALHDAFLRTDAEFVRKSNQEQACGGATAVVVVIRGKTLHAAWAGDSQALLAKRMRLLQLVTPHKPGREDERERIEAAGGTVIHWGTWRVNGQLAVSRAIGDAPYKPYVTARPDFDTVQLDGDEDFVVIACDGLWDFASEDMVALEVYCQIENNPDDLKTVSNNLILQAKRQGSTDNISVIVVFLKEPRAIAADNCSAMVFGQDNALATAPPAFLEGEVCRQPSAPAAEGLDDAEPVDNGADSDSDSEDLGPETAVDADDVDAEKNHEPAPPTPIHIDTSIVEPSHVEVALLDNVAESGEESEDEWNYFKGEGEQAATDLPSEEPRSETPCQDNDNSAWESSSVDMNSSPLNPDAPVFIPNVGGDILLAESPRKPQPMDDIELPDNAQFQTGAVIRPAELLDLDNCDQLNGHHNVSLDEASKEQLNGNDKHATDSLGFGFGGDEKTQDFIQDFERIQKDTTDFCNIEVLQTHESNPFAVSPDEPLLERLRGKELGGERADPMTMSFYQEKDDDTCDRFNAQHAVDLNAVQPLPDSDDDTNDDQHDHDAARADGDKENVQPREPDNDREHQLQNNLFSRGDNLAGYGCEDEAPLEFHTHHVLQTETPESHKLLFEQIPEIPDGKSSELGFGHDSEREQDDENSQDVDMESKQDESPADAAPEPGLRDPEPEEEEDNRLEGDFEHRFDDSGIANEAETFQEQTPAVEPEEIQEPVQNSHFEHNDFASERFDSELDAEKGLEFGLEESEDKLQHDFLSEAAPEFHTEVMQPAQSPAPVLTPSPAPAESPAENLAPALSPVPAESPAPEPTSDLAESPEPTPVQAESPAPEPTPVLPDTPTPAQSPVPAESPAPAPAQSPFPAESPAPAPTPSPAPAQSPEPARSPSPFEIVEAPVEATSPLPVASFASTELLQPSESSVPLQSPLPAASPLPADPAPSPSPAPSPAPPADAPAELPVEEPPAARLSPEPQPDIVPERAELVTDLDAVEALVQEAGAPAEPAAPAPQAAGVALAAAPAAAAVAVAAAVAATKTPAKKTTPTTKTTPAAKTTPKPTAAKTSTTARTPLSAAKKAPAASPAAKPAASPRASLAAKPAAPKPTTALKSPATKTAAPRAAAARPAAAAAAAAKPAPARESITARPAPITRAAPARPALTKPAPAAKPAPRAAAAAPAAARPAPRPAPARAPITRPAATKPAEKKPLTNGDAKPAAEKKPLSAPAPRAPISRPAAARPASAAAPAKLSAAAPRPAPAPRAAPRAPLDKPTKELANKRATTVTKTAPPRTAPIKAPSKAAAAKPAPPKGSAPKPVPKKAVAKPAPAPAADAEPAPALNGLSNGHAAADKAPPADAALLPDVIA